MLQLYSTILLQNQFFSLKTNEKKRSNLKQVQPKFGKEKDAQSLSIYIFFSIFLTKLFRFLNYHSLMLFCHLSLVTLYFKVSCLCSSYSKLWEKKINTDISSVEGLAEVRLWRSVNFLLPSFLQRHVSWHWTFGSWASQRFSYSEGDYR